MSSPDILLYLPLSGHSTIRPKIMSILHKRTNNGRFLPYQPSSPLAKNHNSGGEEAINNSSPKPG